MNTLYVNLYGGPGTGKSTSAAWIYSALKNKGVNAELVREYVKDWAWEGRNVTTYDQIYLLGKQIRRESLVLGKVEVVVTDSPVLQSVYYSHRYLPEDLAKAIEALALAYYRQVAADGHKHVHVLLGRSKPYDPSGRYQTEEQAREVDRGVAELLNRHQIEYIGCGTDTASLETLLSVLRK